MNPDTFKSFLKCYQELSIRVIESAHHDILDESIKKEMINWLIKHPVRGKKKKKKSKKDLSISRKRTRIEKKLLMDKDAMQFLSSEYFEFWQAIVDLHNT